MRIFVTHGEVDSAQTQNLDVDPSDTIGHVKGLLESVGINVLGCRLSFAGWELHDSCNLIECNIQSRSTIHLTPASGDLTGDEEEARIAAGDEEEARIAAEPAFWSTFGADLGAAKPISKSKKKQAPLENLISTIGAPKSS